MGCSSPATSRASSDYVVCRLFDTHWSFQRGGDRLGGFGTLGSHYNKIPENSEEKEVQRKKEVDDLISKYASKKKVSLPQHDYTTANSSTHSGIAPTSSSTNLANSSIGNDYATLRYGSLRDNLYGTSRENLYGTAARRRSSQYDTYADTTVTPSNAYVPPYSSAASSSNLYSRANDYNSITSTATTGPRRYLATSKSSTNIYLHPTSTSGYDYTTKSIPEPSRIQTRQQKTLSMHGLPTLPAPAIQPRMSSGAGTTGVLPSSSLSSFHHLLNQPSNDWSWNSGVGAPILNHHHTYHSAVEPVSTPGSKGLGFWTNPSSLLPVGTKRNFFVLLCFPVLSVGFSRFFVSRSVSVFL